jgi:heme exporter protein A
LLEPLIGRSSGRTRVLVTHDVARGIAEADALIGLRGGRIQVAGPTSGTAGVQAEALFA